MTLSFVFWLSFFHLTVAYFASSMQQQPPCRDNERSALLQFKNSLIIHKPASSWDPLAYPKVASWNLQETNSDCCSWDGIKCNEETGHVIRLDLSSSCLYGSINSTSTLFHLVHLQWLSLANNHFNSSEIPATIKHLSSLKHLNLSCSHFSGQIPSELLDLSNLVSLDLSFNYYPPTNLELRNPGLRSLVEKLNNLKVLNLGDVYIPSSVPHNLANLSSLTYLLLEECELQGEFPTEIFQLPNLSFLSLSFNNDLSGYIPEFESSNSLTFLDISSCNFSGKIPSSIGNLTKLIHLYIYFNNFFGELPNSLGNLASLKSLSIFGCNFSGPIPSSLGNLTQLTGLHMRQNRLTGQIPSSLGNLTRLTSLYFGQNQLAGPIPSSLCNLIQLISLSMGQNQLTGPIPSCLMNINHLSFLWLESNQLTGQIPLEIRNLTQLIHLDLSSNSLKGLIPNTIFEFKNLQNLLLQSNNLSGTVDLDMVLHKLKQLQELSLSSNHLSVLSRTCVNTSLPKLMVLGLRSCNLTEFPNFLHSQDRLSMLDLSSNKMSGQIPEWFLNLRMDYLQSLNLSKNLFTGFGQHHVLLSWSTELLTLDLSFNKMQGPLPLPPPSTNHFLMSNNMLNGEIPPQICNLKRLHTLDLSNNNLSGVLPPCLGYFSYDLSVLALRSNKFHGSIPQIFMNATNLRMIDLSNNKLQGRIPRSLVDCSMLEFLHLGNNQINDIFPSWLGTLTELKILILKSNLLHGVIETLTETKFEFPKLHVIDLSHNNFRGKLPTKFFRSWNAMKVVDESRLTYLHNKLELSSYIGQAFTEFLEYAYSMTIDNKGIETNYGKISNMFIGIILSGNKFEGVIPASIASLRGLNSLNLSQNNFEGRIPSFLGNLTALESLDLSNNRLSGRIPQQLVEITYLEVFDVSHNQLTGVIPHGKQFDTFENSSYFGNPELCGKPLSKECEPFEPSKKELDEDTESPFVFDWKIVLIGFASGLIIGVVLGQEFYTAKHEWFVKIFGMERKKRRGCRN